MNVNTKPRFGFTGNQLKIIALVAMTCDHIGYQLFPALTFLRIIGRLAFPIFAYMIAEGCFYTKNRLKYILTMAGVGVVCQLVYFFAMDSLYQCIFITFTLSVCLIYAIDYAVKKQTVRSVLLAALVLFAVCFVVLVLPLLLSHTDFRVDYDIWGVMLPVFVYFAKNKPMKICATALALVLIASMFGGVQWYSLLALPLLALYTGKRGKYKMKYLFYIYYPLHLVVLYGIDLWVL